MTNKAKNNAHKGLVNFAGYNGNGYGGAAAAYVHGPGTGRGPKGPGLLGPCPAPGKSGGLNGAHASGTAKHEAKEFNVKFKQEISEIEAKEVFETLRDGDSGIAVGNPGIG